MNSTSPKISPTSKIKRKLTANTVNTAKIKSTKWLLAIFNNQIDP